MSQPAPLIPMTPPSSRRQIDGQSSSDSNPATSSTARNAYKEDGIKDNGRPDYINLANNNSLISRNGSVSSTYSFTQNTNYTTNAPVATPGQSSAARSTSLYRNITTNSDSNSQSSRQSVALYIKKNHDSNEVNVLSSSGIMATDNEDGNYSPSARRKSILDPSRTTIINKQDSPLVGRRSSFFGSSSQDAQTISKPNYPNFSAAPRGVSHSRASFSKDSSGPSVNSSFTDVNSPSKGISRNPTISKTGTAYLTSRDNFKGLSRSNTVNNKEGFVSNIIQQWNQKSSSNTAPPMPQQHQIYMKKTLALPQSSNKTLPAKRPSELLPSTVFNLNSTISSANSLDILTVDLKNDINDKSSNLNKSYQHENSTSSVFSTVPIKSPLRREATTAGIYNSATYGGQYSNISSASLLSKTPSASTGLSKDNNTGSEQRINYLRPRTMAGSTNFNTNSASVAKIPTNGASSTASSGFMINGYTKGNTTALPKSVNSLSKTADTNDEYKTNKNIELKEKDILNRDKSIISKDASFKLDDSYKLKLDTNELDKFHTELSTSLMDLASSIISSKSNLGSGTINVTNGPLGVAPPEVLFDKKPKIRDDVSFRSISKKEISKDEKISENKRMARSIGDDLNEVSITPSVFKPFNEHLLKKDDSSYSSKETSSVHTDNSPNNSNKSTDYKYYFIDSNQPRYPTIGTRTNSEMSDKSNLSKLLINNQQVSSPRILSPTNSIKISENNNANIGNKNRIIKTISRTFSLRRNNSTSTTSNKIENPDFQREQVYHNINYDPYDDGLGKLVSNSNSYRKNSGSSLTHASFLNRSNSGKSFDHFKDDSFNSGRRLQNNKHSFTNLVSSQTTRKVPLLKNSSQPHMQSTTERIIDNRYRSDSVPHVGLSQSLSASNSHLGIEPVDVLDVSAKEIARQLTITDSELFRRVNRDELNSLSWSGPNKRTSAPTITACTESFNKVALWVAGTIVSSDRIKRRFSLVCHFISVAKYCSDLNNYNGVRAITAGLQSTPVHRLERTWAMVGRREKASFDKLCEMMSPLQNSYNYREKLADSKGPTVPYLGTWLSDLTYLYECLKKEQSLPHRARHVKEREVQIEALLDEIYKFQINSIFSFEIKPSIQEMMFGRAYDMIQKKEASIKSRYSTVDNEQTDFNKADMDLRNSMLETEQYRLSYKVEPKIEPGNSSSFKKNKFRLNNSSNTAARQSNTSIAGSASGSDSKSNTLRGVAISASSTISNSTNKLRDLMGRKGSIQNNDGTEKKPQKTGSGNLESPKKTNDTSAASSESNTLVHKNNNYNSYELTHASFSALSNSSQTSEYFLQSIKSPHDIALRDTEAFISVTDTDSILETNHNSLQNDTPKSSVDDESLNVIAHLNISKKKDKRLSQLTEVSSIGESMRDVSKFRDTEHDDEDDDDDDNVEEEDEAASSRMKLGLSADSILNCQDCDIDITSSYDKIGKNYGHIKMKSAPDERVLSSSMVVDRLGDNENRSLYSDINSDFEVDDIKHEDGSDNEGALEHSSNQDVYDHNQTASQEYFNGKNPRKARKRLSNSHISGKKGANNSGKVEYLRDYISAVDSNEDFFSDMNKEIAGVFNNLEDPVQSAVEANIDANVIASASAASEYGSKSKSDNENYNSSNNNNQRHSYGNNTISKYEKIKNKPISEINLSTMGKVNINAKVIDIEELEADDNVPGFTSNISSPIKAFPDRAPSTTGSLFNAIQTMGTNDYRNAIDSSLNSPLGLSNRNESTATYDMVRRCVDKANDALNNNQSFSSPHAQSIVESVQDIRKVEYSDESGIVSSNMNTDYGGLESLRQSSIIFASSSNLNVAVEDKLNNDKPTSLVFYTKQKMTFSGDATSQIAQVNTNLSNTSTPNIPAAPISNKNDTINNPPSSKSKGLQGLLRSVSFHNNNNKDTNNTNNSSESKKKKVFGNFKLGSKQSNNNNKVNSNSNDSGNQITSLSETSELDDQNSEHVVSNISQSSGISQPGSETIPSTNSYNNSNTNKSANSQTTHKGIKKIMHFISKK